MENIAELITLLEEYIEMRRWKKEYEVFQFSLYFCIVIMKIMQYFYT